MVLSLSRYDEDDPRSVYKAKKLKASVQIKSFKSAHTGIIKSDPDGKSIADLQSSPIASTANSSYRSHTGHGRSSVSPIVQVAPESTTPASTTPASTSSTSSHTNDPNYYGYEPDAREDRSNTATTRSVPVSSREQSDPEETVGSSVAERLAAYRKNAKTVSSPKISNYSAAVNADRYVKSPMAPVVTRAPRQSLQRGDAQNAENASTNLSGTTLSVETSPQLDEEEVPVSSKFQNVSSPRKGVKPIAAATSSDSSITKSVDTSADKSSDKSSNTISDQSSDKGADKSSDKNSEVEKFDDDILEDPTARSQDYWSNLKQKQRAKKRAEKAKSSPLFVTCGGLNDDDSTVISNNTDMSSAAGSWNLLDNMLVGKKEGLGLVSEGELLCDFEDSGIDRIKKIHQYLKSLTRDDESADLVGRDIVATDMTTDEPHDDDTPESAGSAHALNKKDSDVASDEETMKNTQLNAMKETENDWEKNAKKGAKKDTGAERSTDVHTVKYNPRKSKTAIASEQYMAAVTVSNTSVTSSQRRCAKDDSFPAQSKEDPVGASPARDADSEAMMKPGGSAAMVEAGSTASVKSVRFSEKIDVDEPKEVPTPDVPSLLDDQVEEDEQSIASSPEHAPVAVVVEEKEAIKKKKGFFKKLLRHAKKRKSKKRGASSEPFEPTLEPMNEEVEEEGETFTSDAVSAKESEAAETSNKEPSSEDEPSSTQESPKAAQHGGGGGASEGFELIAGCTKTGKKAIMIAKAKNERSKRRSEDVEPTAIAAPLDPPPSAAITTTDHKKEATSVVASEQERTIDVDNDVVHHQARNLIQMHSDKHGVRKQDLMDRVPHGGSDQKKSGNKDGGDDTSVGSVTETFVNEGDSHYHGDSTVASQLLSIFDALFTADVRGGEDDDGSVQSSTVRY